MPRFVLNQDEMTELDVPAEGTGGFQALMHRLQADLNRETGEICVSDEDVDRLRRYCTDYGPGGFQGRFARAFRRVLDEADDET